MSKVLVTGSNGQLGSELKELAKGQNKMKFTFTDVTDLDITDAKAVEQYFKNNEFDWAINCAAYTGVDKAESDAETAYKINAEAVKHLAVACHKQGVRFIHISTDFVFYGHASKPYDEKAPTSPRGVYGLTKLQGEQHCRVYNKESIIIRTSWLYSSYGNNFVKTMLRFGAEREVLNVVFDQVGTPTYAADLAETILFMIDRYGELAQPGIYHYSNEGVASWYDFAVAIMEEKDVACKVYPIESYQYPTPAKRPPFSVLNKKKIKETFGLNIPHWRDGLRRCLAKL